MCYDCFQVILRSSEHIDKAYFYTFLHKWLGTGLLTATGNSVSHFSSLARNYSLLRARNDNMSTCHHQGRDLDDMSSFFLKR